jgi:poly(A) polymerase
MVKLKQKPELHASWIDHSAKEIVRTLQKGGFTSYLVGGCVRDLLVGLHPKDYDIATNAEPNQVRKLIRGSYVIGKRFRLVLVKRGTQQFEVATFRREMTPEDLAEAQEDSEESESPVRVGDNFFGTPEQDALRRDFTVNALFYDPIQDQLIDYAEALKDIEARCLRMIGDPATRIKEDPIRSLRAIRLAHKIGFQIEPGLRDAIKSEAAEVLRGVLPRRREEYLKFLRLKDPIPALNELYDLDLMKHILPTLHHLWENEQRREIFLHYIARGAEFCKDPSNALHVYLPLVLAVIRSLEGIPDEEFTVMKLLRDEFGMFKSEIAFLIASLEMAHNLPQVHSFMKRGARRRAGFLKNETLEPALLIAEKDYLLSGSTLAFWKAQLESSGILNQEVADV